MCRCLSQFDNSLLSVFRPWHTFIYSTEVELWIVSRVSQGTVLCRPMRAQRNNHVTGLLPMKWGVFYTARVLSFRSNAFQCTVYHTDADNNSSSTFENFHLLTFTLLVDMVVRMVVVCIWFYLSLMASFRRLLATWLSAFGLLIHSIWQCLLNLPLEHLCYTLDSVILIIVMVAGQLRHVNTRHRCASITGMWKVGISGLSSILARLPTSYERGFPRT